MDRRGPKVTLGPGEHDARDTAADVQPTALQPGGGAPQSWRCHIDWHDGDRSLDAGAAERGCLAVGLGGAAVRRGAADGLSRGRRACVVLACPPWTRMNRPIQELDVPADANAHRVRPTARTHSPIIVLALSDGRRGVRRGCVRGRRPGGPCFRQCTRIFWFAGAAPSSGSVRTVSIRSFSLLALTLMWPIHFEISSRSPFTFLIQYLWL